MKKRSLTLLLTTICAFSLLLTACAPAAGQPAPTPVETVAPAQSAAPTPGDSHYPVTITTYNYAKEPVELTFEKAPERVYAQAQDNIEILLALGLGDKIVGCSGLDGAIRSDLADGFSKLNYYDSMPSKEEILGLDPDFITGWYSTFGEKRLGEVDFWHQRGTNTYMALNSGCRGKAAEHPQTIEEECQDILTLGKIFDVEEKAQAIVDEIHAELAKIANYVADHDKFSVAVLEDEGGTYRVYSEDALGGNVAIQAGAELAVGKHGESGNIGAEDLIATNPDAIFMVWYEGYSVGDVDYAGEQVVKLITENPAFASLDAVKNGTVYPINLSGIFCSGMRTLDGVLDFAKNLYPELYQ